MGRQRFMTNLALGRSPYETPERTRDGQFIYNRVAAHRLWEADDYYQQFDDRGRPENPPQRRAERRIARAQNDVNSTFGIVVSKEQDQREREEREKQKEKDDDLQQEDETGLVMQIVDAVLAFQLQWSVFTMRNRYQTFHNLSDVSIIRALRFQSRQVGAIGVLTAGLPAFWLFKGIQLSREMLADHLLETVAERRFHRVGEKAVKMLNVTSQLMLEFPLLQFCTLQALHLMSPTTIPYFKFWFPFSSYSIVPRVRVPSIATTRAFIRGSIELITHPLVLVYLYYFLQDKVMSYIDGFIEDNLLADTEPPRITLVDGLSGPNVSVPTDANNQSPTLLGALNKELSKLYTLVSSFYSPKAQVSQAQAAQRSYSDLSVNEIDQINVRSMSYQEEALAHAAGTNHAQRRELRLEAHRRAWEEAGVVPPEYVTETMIETHSESGSSSTATPDEADFEAVLGSTGERTTSPSRISEDANRVRHSSSTTPLPSDSTSRQRTSRMHEILETTDSNQGLSNSPAPTSNSGAPIGWSARQVPSRASSLYPPQPASPATTPPTSPLLRASLVHHDAETVTMQLEVIQPPSPRPSISRPRQASTTAAQSDFLNALPNGAEASNLLDAAAALGGGNFPLGTATRTTISTSSRNGPTNMDTLSQPVLFDHDSVQQQLAARVQQQRQEQITRAATTMTTNETVNGSSASEPSNAVIPTVPITGTSTTAEASSRAERRHSLPPFAPGPLPLPTTSQSPRRRSSTSNEPRYWTRDDAIRLALAVGAPSLEAARHAVDSRNWSAFWNPGGTTPSTTTTTRPSSAPRNQNQPQHDTGAITANNADDDALTPTAANANANARRARQNRRPTTSLTTFPASTLSSHLARTLTAFVLLPIEAHYLRALAHAFLQTSTPHTAALGLGEGVLRVRGLGLGGWFGGGGTGAGTGTGGMRDRIGYVGQMAVLLGLQGLIGVGVWGVEAMGVEWMGGRWWGWGRGREGSGEGGDDGAGRGRGRG